VGANAEHKINPPAGHEPVRWIGASRCRPTRSCPSLRRVLRYRMAAATARAKWMAGAVAVAVIAVVAFILWRGHTRTRQLQRLQPNKQSAGQRISPGVTSVSSSVTFTGTISARYDMPIGIEGDAGRIVGVYVEAGDHVKTGSTARED